MNLFPFSTIDLFCFTLDCPFENIAFLYVELPNLLKLQFKIESPIFPIVPIPVVPKKTTNPSKTLVLPPDNDKYFKQLYYASFLNTTIGALELEFMIAN